MPNIVAFRVDERLIHGQGQVWIKALGANTVIVAKDAASEDPIQQQLMKAVVPKTIACVSSLSRRPSTSSTRLPPSRPSSWFARAFPML